MINQQDRRVIRELAKRVQEIANQPIMDERRALWKRHNRLERVRPMILVFPEGAWYELIPSSVLQCEGDRAREIEWKLRNRIYYYECIQDDTVIEDTWIVEKAITHTGWGLSPRRIGSSEPSGEFRVDPQMGFYPYLGSKPGGAWGFDPVINEPSDLLKLTYPKIYYDSEKTQRDLQEAQGLLGDILKVKLKGISRVSFHLMNLYSSLRGLEQVMLDMYARPNMLHDAMAFFEEGHRQLVQQYIDRNLLSLNNDDTYHSSGGVSYSTELPRADYDPQRIHPSDMWASAESQEMAQVSPSMHATFALEYEKRLLEIFGLTGYGCCDDLTNKLDYVFRIPNLRRISISPWADVRKCAEKLQDDYIFSWKHHPGYMVGEFDECKICEYVKHTLDATKDCVLEIILKDVHTCENRPERFVKWTSIVRNLIC